jgi:hypothetical protein
MPKPAVLLMLSFSHLRVTMLILAESLSGCVPLAGALVGGYVVVMLFIFFVGRSLGNAKKARAAGGRRKAEEAQQTDLNHDPGAFFAFLKALEKVIFPISCLFGVAGMTGGFYVGGVGGAIVGAPVGFIVGFVLVYSLPLVLVSATAILAVVLGVAAIILVIWLIYSLWGVGKP